MSTLVGEAHVIVRAITSKVDEDIRKGFSGSSSTGGKAGDAMGKSFSRGFNKNVNQNTFSRIADGLKTLSPGAQKAREAFQKLLATGYVLQTALSTILPAVFSLIGGLGAIAGSAAGAIGSLAALGNVIFALAGAMAVAKLALGGVGKALSALNKPASGGGGSGGAADQARIAAAKAVESAEKSLARTIEQNREDLINANNDVRDAQLALNDAIKAGREEIQQLGFDAEDAALNEKSASLELEKARIALAKAQDLPPNSRVRQEAELAYQEADLNLRKAKDRSADLNAEQDKLAKTGVAGTQAVIDATNALARAEANKSKTVRDAARSEADAQQNLADAKDNAATAGDSGGGGGGSDPFAGLNQAQIDFVNFIQSLRPKFDELKAIAANSFLPPLQTAITLLADKAFPVVAAGIGILGASLGQAAISIATAITSAENLEKLGRLFATSGPLIEQIGTAIGSAFGIFLSILNATAPIAERFFTFLNTKLAAFDAYLNSVQGNKALTDFFGKAADAMALFGSIFGNIFDTIGGIIQANLGPGTGGGYLLTWIDKVTSGWAAFNDTVEGQQALKGYFLAASINAQAVLSAVGDLLGIFKDLATSPDIKTAFDVLKEGVPALREIVSQSLKAAPSLAGLLVSATKLIAAMTDTGAIQVFFDTFKGVIDFISGLLENGIAGPILTAHGRIIAFTAVFGILGTIGGFAFKVIIGGLTNLIAPIGLAIGAVSEITGAFALAAGGAGTFTEALALMAASQNPLVGAFGKIGGAVGKFGGVLKTAFTGPVGIVLGVIAVLVAAFVLLYNTSDTFHKQVDEIFGQLQATLAPLLPVFAQLAQTLISALLPIVQKLAPVFLELVQALLPLLTAILIPLLPVIVQVVSALAPLVTILVTALLPVIEALLPAFKITVDILTIVIDIISALIQTISALLSGDLSKIGPIWSDLWTNVQQVFGDVWNNIQEIITNAWNFIVDFVTTAQAIFTDINIKFWGGIFSLINDIWTNIGLLIVGAWNGIVAFFTGAFVLLAQIWNDFWAGLFGFVSDVFNNVLSFLVGVVGNIVAYFVNSFNTLGSFWSNFWNTAGSVVSSVFNGIVNAVRGAVNGIIGAVEGMVNSVVGGINGLIGGINGALGAIGGAIGVKLSVGSIPRVSLPRLAQGGTVFPSPGGSIVNVAEAGRPERIEPLDANGLSARDKALIDHLANGGGGTTIQVFAAPGMDINELAAEVDRRISFKMGKGKA